VIKNNVVNTDLALFVKNKRKICFKTHF